MKKLKKEAIQTLAAEQGVIPPFNHTDPATAVAITEAAYRGGLRIFEFTHRSENALDVFSAMIKARPKKYPDMVLGVGTIMNVKQARQYYKAGAQFIVAPTLNKAVGNWCAKENVFWCPGAGSATEAVQAHEWGASLIKIFPAEVLGPRFIKALKAPCPWLKLMPSGGVTLEKENLKQWFSSGVACVAIGSHLFTNVLEEKNYGLLEARIRQLLADIRELRNQ